MRKVVLGSAVVVALGLAGCQTVGITGNTALATAGFSYQAGTASQSFPFAATQVQPALLEAMADLKMTSVRQTQEGKATSYHGLTADGRRVSVTVSRVPGAAAGAIEAVETQSVLTARVGWLGDEPLSRALMDRVGIRMGSMPAAAIPSDPPSSPEKGTFFGGRETLPPSVRRMNDAGYRDTPVP
jgi:Protein of unknown function (DUF3568)